MRVVAIGDVGVVDGMIHIGDEAMFEACIGELRARGVGSILGISANPADTAARYGIDAIGSADNQAISDAVGTSDAVVITGGGNLSSLWPRHVRTRAEIGALAAHFGKPLVVTGQTLGPQLDAADSAQVAGLLGSARLVGVREGSSLALAQRLGISPPALRQTVDDASFLVTDPVEPGGYCLVVLANHVGSADRDSVARAIARLLDRVAASTGLEVVFAAHFGSLEPGPARGDSVMHERVAAYMTTAADFAPTTDSIAAARLARNAALVICSRYHPAVFAVSAGVPTIGIPVDDYTNVKLTGALANFGQSSTLPVEQLLAHGGDAILDSTWSARDNTRREGESIAATARLRSAQWWDDVADALAGP